MNKFLLSLMALGMASAAQASTSWTLTKANKVYQVDTIYHATIGPGTTYTELALNGQYLERCFYLTIDLKNPNVEVRALKAGDNRVGRKTVPVIATDHDVDGALNHFAGVNSDFFNMSTPYYTNGMSVCTGTLQSYQNAVPWKHWVIDKDRKQYIASSSLTYTPYITMPNNGGTWYFYLNGTRAAGTLHIYQYDREVGGTQTTGCDATGAECIVRPVDGAFPMPVYNCEWEVVSTPVANAAGMTIPKDGYVLSGHGGAANAIKRLAVGDKFTSVLNFKLDGTAIPTPAEVSGCNNVLIKDGVHIDIDSSNAPRTFVGYNKENDKCILMAIDGRQDGWSAGVYYRLGAAIMEKVGCYNAVELDGGGSTTMYVKPLGGLKNKPSDGAMRTVACGLYATAVCGKDWNVTSMEVKQKNVTLNNNATFTPVLYGYNKYGVMIDNNITGYTLEAPASLGTISADGKTLTTSANGKGYQVLTVKYGQLKITIPVKLPGEAGVDDVTIDESDAPAEYYSLGGIRVDNPTTGLYIVRRGSKVTKEVIR